MNIPQPSRRRRSEKRKLYSTSKGTPQGGIISPVIMNMVLDGLETVINRQFPRWKNLKVNFVRYADDFIITAKDTFNKMSTFIFWQLWKWANHQHGNKGHKWIYCRYFLNNNFSDTRISSKGTYVYKLYRIGYVPIRYHVKISGNANPYLPEFDQYFAHRLKYKSSLAKECKQITTFVHKVNNNSRVSFNKVCLKSA